jgi:hypothetical protein
MQTKVHKIYILSLSLYLRDSYLYLRPVSFPV